MADTGPQPFPTSAAPSTPARSSAPDRRRARAEEGRIAFLRLASHELRTPLNAILGFSEIISEELYGPLDEPRYREHAAMIHQSGLKLLRLVNQVLDIARLEMGAGDLDLRPEPCLVAMAAAERAVAAEAAARGVTLARRLEPGAEWALADARGLAMALTHLLQNAVQASPEGGEVRLLARPLPDGRVALAVEDDGPGLPAAALVRVVRPFEQGTSALERGADGSGLGLPTTRLLAEAMGGTLRLTSEVGRGLCAVLRLPAAPAPARPGPKTLAAA